MKPGILARRAPSRVVSAFTTLGASTQRTQPCPVNGAGFDEFLRRGEDGCRGTDLSDAAKSPLAGPCCERLQAGVEA
jgi:hypothetical protein